MKSTIKKISESKREIEIEVGVEEVKKELEMILTRYASQVKIPGFRPGKAPKDVIKRRFYPEIKDSLINSLVPKALDKEIQSQNLKLVGMPVVNEIHFKEDEPFTLRAQFDIWPDIVLPDYKNVEIKKRKVTVKEEEVNRSLEELRIGAAQYVPVEGRGVGNGDYVVVEAKGRDEKTKRFFPTEKVVVLVGDPNNEKTLNQKLIGLNPNENCQFTVTYDKDHQNKKLAGKEVSYDVKVISIKERKIPEINDDFAKDLGEYENLGDLKKKIKESLMVQKEKEVRGEEAEEIIKGISDKVDFEPPETLVEQEYQAVMKRLLSAQNQKELKKEEVEELKKEGREKAAENIKHHLIIDKIAEQENIEVKEEEVQEELKAIAKANNLTLAQVINVINKEGRREELKNSLQFKKTVDFLVENAIIK